MAGYGVCRKGALPVNGCELCHFSILVLSSTTLALLKGDQVPESIVRKYGREVNTWPRHHFTAWVPIGLSFPDGEISKEEAQAWVNAREAEGVVFHPQDR
jgi:hypothetical protein